MTPNQLSAEEIADYRERFTSPSTFELGPDPHDALRMLDTIDYLTAQLEKTHKGRRLLLLLVHWALHNGYPEGKFERSLIRRIERDGE